MRRLTVAGLGLTTLFSPRLACGQATPVVVETRVRLRAGPSITAPTLRLLEPRDSLSLIGSDSVSSDLLYLHVSTPRGDTGWVSTSFAHRVRRINRTPSDTTRPPDAMPLGSAVPLPASTAPASTANILRRCGGGCGSERWRVKTLADLDETEVDFAPLSATVAQLRSFPHPANTSSTHRSGDVERTTYQVDGRLIGWLKEGDQDVHLVIEAMSGIKTIIAEIPNKACSYVCSSPKLTDFNHARAALITQLGNPPSTYHTMAPVPVTITGVGFFDFKHHQHGLAPNAIELHPVLSIVFK
jgi:hypothetical protein